MSQQERKVRSKHGLLPWKGLEYHGFSIQAIKEWRRVEFDAGRACGHDDFYAAHGLCFDCGSGGAQMIGWSEPTNAAEAESVLELGLEKLPTYETCSTCGGSGKADRSHWKRRPAKQQ